MDYVTFLEKNYAADGKVYIPTVKSTKTQAETQIGLPHKGW